VGPRGGRELGHRRGQVPRAERDRCSLGLQLWAVRSALRLSPKVVGLAAQLLRSDVPGATRYSVKGGVVRLVGLSVGNRGGVMGQRRSDRRAEEDLPWNDAPADSSSFPGHEEPDPAEIVGDENRPRDISLREPRPRSAGESLDERLRAEEPDRSQRPVPHGLEIVEGEEPERDLYGSEELDEEDDELPAEEAALHLVE